MQESDKSALVEFLNSLYEYYNVKENGNLKKATLVTASIYYNSLKDYSLNDVMGAGAKHLQDPSSGQFFPKVADFIRYLKVEEGLPDIKPDEALAMAVEPTTPLGVIARIEMGTFTLLNETDPFVRKQSAMVFLQKLPDIYKRIINGGYTFHEIGVMEKFGVSLKSPIYHGMEPLNSNAMKNVLETYKKHCNDNRYLIAAQKIEHDEYVDRISESKDLELPPPNDIKKIKEEWEAIIKKCLTLNNLRI